MEFWFLSTSRAIAKTGHACSVSIKACSNPLCGETFARLVHSSPKDSAFSFRAASCQGGAPRVQLTLQVQPLLPTSPNINPARVTIKDQSYHVTCFARRTLHMQQDGARRKCQTCNSASSLSHRPITVAGRCRKHLPLQAYHCEFVRRIHPEPLTSDINKQDSSTFMKQSMPWCGEHRGHADETEQVYPSFVAWMPGTRRAMAYGRPVAHQWLPCVAVRCCEDLVESDGHWCEAL